MRELKGPVRAVGPRGHWSGEGSLLLGPPGPGELWESTRWRWPRGQRQKALRGGAAGLGRSAWPGFSAALTLGQLLASSCAFLSPSARTLSRIFPKRQALFTPFAASATSASSKLRDSNFWGNQKNGEVPPSLRYLGLRAWRRGAPCLVGRCACPVRWHVGCCVHTPTAEPGRWQAAARAKRNPSEQREKQRLG